MINLLILFAETIFPRYSLPFIIIVICSSSIYLKVSRKDKEPIDLVNVSRLTATLRGKTWGGE